MQVSVSPYDQHILSTIIHVATIIIWFAVAAYAHYFLRRWYTLVQIISTSAALIMVVLSKWVFHPVWGVHPLRSVDSIMRLHTIDSVVFFLCFWAFFVGYVPVLRRAVRQGALSRISLLLQIVGAFFLIAERIVPMVLVRLMTLQQFITISKEMAVYPTKDIAAMLFLAGYGLMLLRARRGTEPLEKLPG